jgi:Zn-dependent protease
MCLFVSVVVHELGHALVAEAFRWQSEIVLYWCGGVALSQRYHGRSPWKEIAVALAGPCAGFGLFGLVLGINFLLTAFHVRQPAEMYQIYGMLIFINLFWGLVNLLPALPLDGGHVCQSLLEVLRSRNPLRTAMQISVLVAGGAAFVFFMYLDSHFAGMLFAMIALQNLAALQEPRH